MRSATDLIDDRDYLDAELYPELLEPESDDPSLFSSSVESISSLPISSS